MIEAYISKRKTNIHMNTTLIIAVVAVLVVAVVVIVLNKANAVVKGELAKKENDRKTCGA